MDVVCADKTGTLTMNLLTLAGVQPQPGFTEDDVIRDGAFASNEADQDHIDLAFLRAARERKLLGEPSKTLSFMPFSPQTRRTEAVVEYEGGQIRVVKGALHTVAEAAGLDAPAIAKLEARANEEAQKGFRVLAVARGKEDGPLALIGLAFLYDPPRPDSRRLIEELKSLGVSVKMLTGDALPVAREVARELGLGDIAAASGLRAAQDPKSESARNLVQGSSGFAEVFPEDKFLVVKSLQEAGHITGMTGDGVNDAPALRQAEVGIAVASATDVAKGAASVVLTTEGLVGITELITIGRAIYQRVLTWIINKISRTISKSGLVVFAFFVTGKLIIPALGIILLVFMTDFVKIALSTDRVRSSQHPESWNIERWVGLAAVFGLLMLAEELALLFAGWRLFDLGNHPGALNTFTFETLLFFALFSIMSIRERRAWWSSWPSKTLGIALFADGCAGLAIAYFGLGEFRPLPLPAMAFIAVLAMVLSLTLNDFVKAAYIKRVTAAASAPRHGGMAS
jgi:magnesium-transporting ATPase (P-type)